MKKKEDAIEEVIRIKPWPNKAMIPFDADCTRSFNRKVTQNPPRVLNPQDDHKFTSKLTKSLNKNFIIIKSSD